MTEVDIRSAMPGMLMETVLMILSLVLLMLIQRQVNLMSSLAVSMELRGGLVRIQA